MCGIFGIVSSSLVNRRDLSVLIKHAQQRGKDSSGLLFIENALYQVHRADYSIAKLSKEIKFGKSSIVLGHSRLVTNGMSDNQPVVRDGICVFHNGIIVNHEEVWGQIGKTPALQIDTEVIAGIASAHIDEGGAPDDIPARILSLCQGVVDCAMAIPRLGALYLFSNNGSLYVGKKDGAAMYSSEEYPLVTIGCSEIHQVYGAERFDMPVSDRSISVREEKSRMSNLIPALGTNAQEEKLLEYHAHGLRRCTKCLLPETMPFISFDEEGVCNYCRNYKPRNHLKPKEELFELVEPYRRAGRTDCIVPFSGGRDSCYSLHLVVNELKMRPITYTYDWGMVTDLGRRNISRMCAALGVENIIVAADIAKKRRNIAMNLRAWLKAPNLGMVSIFTAGDKHFFRHVETVKKQTGIELNLWGTNSLETTHFKAGFLGMPPNFVGKQVYNSGVMNQLSYHALRFGAMLKSPGYFNSSLWDTLSGEYYRSFHKKKDYYHLFDYWRWDENLVDDTLDEYNWEKAPDTAATWRIGDGTAAFYNYIYYTVAGFTEHDTFRSNQIREGDLTREEALVMIEDENRPRYPNLKWYLDTLGMDFKDVISVINRIPKMYEV